MEEFIARFPVIGQEIFNQLDNQTLTKCKEVSRDLNQFLEDDRLVWTRIIKKYDVNHVDFKEAWKLVVNKVPIEIVKDLAIATESFYTSRCESPLEYQYSPHHIAARAGLLSLLKFIVQKTALLNPANDEGCTGLHYAAIEGHFEVCKYLIEDLEDKNPAAYNGSTPLHDCIYGGYLEIYKIIADHVDDKNPPNNHGITPLHVAAKMGNLEIFKWIADRVDDKNPANVIGYTPLDYARGNYEICKAIIESGEDPNPTTNNGTLALDMARNGEN